MEQRVIYQVNQPRAARADDEAKPIPTWVMKLVYRLMQISDRPGEYTFRLIVHEDGLKELEVIQPPKPERLGY